MWVTLAFVASDGCNHRVGSLRLARVGDNAGQGRGRRELASHVAAKHWSGFDMWHQVSKKIKIGELVFIFGEI